MAVCAILWRLYRRPWVPQQSAIAKSWLCSHLCSSSYIVLTYQPFCQTRTSDCVTHLSMHGRKIIRNNIINRSACLTWFKEEQVLNKTWTTLRGQMGTWIKSKSEWTLRLPHLPLLCSGFLSSIRRSRLWCSFNSHRPSISISNYFHHLLQFRWKSKFLQTLLHTLKLLILTALACSMIRWSQRVRTWHCSFKASNEP